MKLKLFILLFIATLPVLCFAQGGNIIINEQPQNGGVGITPVTTTNSSATMSNDYDQQPVQPPPCKLPMAMKDFKAAKETVVNAGFEDSKLAAAKGILAANCLNTEQVIQICKLFGFEQSKLNFAKSAYPKTTDAANFSKVSNVFSLDASKDDLNNFISKGRW